VPKKLAEWRLSSARALEEWEENKENVLNGK
jgi:hypothetical protein